MVHAVALEVEGPHLVHLDGAEAGPVGSWCGALTLVLVGGQEGPEVVGWAQAAFDLEVGPDDLVEDRAELGVVHLAWRHGCSFSRVRCRGRGGRGLAVAGGAGSELPTGGKEVTQGLLVGLAGRVSCRTGAQRLVAVGDAVLMPVGLDSGDGPVPDATLGGGAGARTEDAG